MCTGQAFVATPVNMRMKCAQTTVLMLQGPSLVGQTRNHALWVAKSAHAPNFLTLATTFKLHCSLLFLQTTHKHELYSGRGSSHATHYTRPAGTNKWRGHSFSLLVKFFNLGNVAKDDSFLSLQAVRKEIGGKSWTTFLHRGREGM